MSTLHLQQNKLFIHLYHSWIKTSRSRLKTNLKHPNLMNTLLLQRKKLLSHMYRSLIKTSHSRLKTNLKHLNLMNTLLLQRKTSFSHLYQSWIKISQSRLRTCVQTPRNLAILKFPLMCLMIVKSLHSPHLEMMNLLLKNFKK